MLLKKHRAIFSNETDECNFSGTMIKKVSSGQDTQVGRVHGGLEEDFEIGYLPVIMCNDIPKIMGLDDAIVTRVSVNTYEKQAKINHDPTNPLEMEKDLNLGTEVNSEEFAEVFVHLFLESYADFLRNGEIPESESMKLAAKSYIGGEAHIIDKFLEMFQITGSPLDFVKSKDIMAWKTSEKQGLSDAKFASEVKRHCTKLKIPEIESKQKKIDGKNVQVWLGIRAL
jgi:phage/plasmid-associated DNA primase